MTVSDSGNHDLELAEATVKILTELLRMEKALLPGSRLPLQQTVALCSTLAEGQVTDLI